MISSSESNKILKKIEEEYNVEKLKLLGFDLWPVLKFNIHKKIIANEISAIGTVKSKFNLVSVFFKIVQYIISHVNSSLLKWKKPKIFYVNFEAHLYKNNKEAINKYYYYVKHVLPLSHQDFFYYSLNIKTGIKSTITGIKIKSGDYRQDAAQVKIKKSIEENKDLLDFKYWLLKRESDLFSKINLLEDLEHSFSLIIDSYHYWQDTFKKHKPKAVFTVCYYTPQNFGLIWAANESKIPVLEIQHGHQINYPPYFFSKGYNFNSLPNYFLTWDNNSYKSINNWTLKTKKHHAINLGNPWAIYWINKYRNEKKDYLNSVKKIAKGRNIIIYSAVAEEDHLPISILKFIKDSEEKYFWLIRTHPRQEKSVIELVNEFKINKMHNVEVSKASSLPLPVLLMNSQLHITSYSSVAIEASQFGLKTILYNKEGKDRYANLSNMIPIDLVDFNNIDYMEDIIKKNMENNVDLKLTLNITAVKKAIDY